jgi:hypothetical protein
LFIFFWPLCCLFFFDIRILITPLVSSNSSSGTWSHDHIYVHNPVLLFSIVTLTYHQNFKSYKMGVTSGTGNAHLSWEPKFTPVFVGFVFHNLLSFVHNYLSFDHCTMYCLSFFDIRLTASLCTSWRTRLQCGRSWVRAPIGSNQRL